MASKLMPRFAARDAITPFMRSPATGPGRIAFTRTPYGPSSIARDFIRPTTAHLLDAYGVRTG